MKQVFSCIVGFDVYYTYIHLYRFMQALRETIRNILQVCLKQNITSIAIPSLGTGKLGYPHHVVADILFAEILVFNETHPAYFKQMVFVLSKKEIYESFMKVYVKQLCLYNEKVSFIET